MSRRRKARFFASGVLVVDKPEGPTSHDVVEKFRRRFGPAKLGHTGTLDPFATGVLVLLFNHATRMADLLGGGMKTYRARLVLGRATDTGDLTGRVTQEAAVPEVAPGAAERALAALVGDRMQEPPAYSAVKHQGKPLYAYAREGLEVKKPPRPIRVQYARLLELGQGHLEFEMTCSRGTYLRGLAEDLARELGTVGHLDRLCRTANLPFTLAEAVGLEEALEWTGEDLAGRLPPLDGALARAGLGAVVLEGDWLHLLRRGSAVPAGVLLSGAREGGPGEGAFRVLAPDGELAAVLNWLPPEERSPGKEYETVRVFPGFPEGGDPGHLRRPDERPLEGGAE